MRHGPIYSKLARRATVCYRIKDQIVPDAFPAFDRFLGLASRKRRLDIPFAHPTPRADPRTPRHTSLEQRVATFIETARYLNRNPLFPAGYSLATLKQIRSEWHDSTTLNETLARAKVLLPEILKTYVIRTMPRELVPGQPKDGKSYTSEGFPAIWQRGMAKAVARGLIKERFTFHDIRAKCVGDSISLEMQ